MIKETIKGIIDQKNFMDNEEMEKQLGFLVWEVKRVMLNRARKIFNEDDEVIETDKFLVELDNAVDKEMKVKKK
jgi:hypothetical protein